MASSNGMRKWVRVTLELPEDFAEDLVAYGPDLIAALREALDRSSTKREQEKAEFDAQQAVLREKHRAIGVRAYRIWRRQEGRNTTRHFAIKQLADEFGIDHVYLSYLLSERRKKLEAYVRNRRLRLIAQLYLDGFSNAEIGDRLGLNPSSVSRLINKNKCAIDQAREHRRNERERVR